MSRVVCAACQEEGRDGCLECGRLPPGFITTKAGVVMHEANHSAALKLAIASGSKGMTFLLQPERSVRVNHVSIGEVVDPLCVVHQDPDLAKLDPGDEHYATDAKRCSSCGSADVKGEGMGCEIWRYVCRTCGADPA